MFVVSLGMSCYILFLMTSNIYRFYIASDYWAETEGVILSVSVEILDNSSSSYRPPGSDSSGGFILKPLYQYWVDSKKYSNDDYQTGAVNSFDSREEAEAIYSEGDTVTVYYSIDNPSKAVLSKDQKVDSYYWFGGFTILFLGIAYILGRRIKESRFN